MIERDECEHGQLRRSCSLCERDAEIARLRQRVEELERDMCGLTGDLQLANNQCRKLEAALREQECAHWGSGRSVGDCMADGDCHGCWQSEALAAAESSDDGIERAFSQLYQVLGVLLKETGRFNTESGQAALDVASDGAVGDPWKRQTDLLAWPWDEPSVGQDEGRPKPPDSYYMTEGSDKRVPKERATESSGGQDGP